jgi:ankyrin repeat protein
MYTETMADSFRELATAVQANQAVLVRAVLESRSELRGRLDEALPDGPFGATALLVAVQRGNLEVVDLLLDAGASIDQKSHWWAGGFGVLYERNALAEALVARGATVDAYAAARQGWLDRLRDLVAAEPAAVRMRGGDGQTPLHVAATVEIADFLLDRGAEIDALDVDHESTPAQYAVRERPEVARRLVERGCRVDVMLAAGLGDSERLRSLLDEHPERVATSVDPRWFPMRDPRAGGTIYNWSLGRHWSLHRVARELDHGAAEALLFERSPAQLLLVRRCELNDAGEVDALLARQPELRGAVPAGEARRLADAAQDGNLEVVRLMLRAGFPVEAGGQEGASALHWAAFHGRIEMARELLGHGAPLELRDAVYDGTPLHWALHGSLHSWERGAGDYGATVAALLAAGAQAPVSFDENRASREAIAALRR